MKIVVYQLYDHLRSQQASGNDLKDILALSRPLQIITRHILRRLVILCPLPHCLKISARMFRVEIWVCGGLLAVPPYLTQHANVDGTH